MKLRVIVRQVLVWLFPPTCVLTGAREGLVEQDGERLDLSLNEYRTLSRLGRVCKICAETVELSPVCGRCLQNAPAFDRSYAAFRYKGCVQTLITDFKYQSKHAHAKLLALLILPYFRSIYETELMPLQAIVPVPLHENRLAERGFNQSLEVAKHLCRFLDIPLLLNGVTRVRETVSQARLSKKQRAKNLNKAFFVDKIAFDGLTHIAILDDVMTTGSTMQSVAQALKKNTNLAVIDAWSIAKA